MPRQDHWNKVREGEGEGEVERVRELCDMVSVNIIINILVHINVHDQGRQSRGGWGGRNPP